MGPPVNYYYTRDHLGSIREVTDASGALRARYDYDPYGNRVVLSGSMNTDFGYTGHYFHQPSGLNLTLYRAYNPALGRWISRDPIGEAAGINLYGYVNNDPIGWTDPLGLDAVTIFGPWGSSISFHIPFTRHIPGEMAHERQHRNDHWDDVSLPPWKMEQRAFRAQANYVKQMIERLKAKDCLGDADRQLIAELENEVITFEIIANNEMWAKDYIKRIGPFFW